MKYSRSDVKEEMLDGFRDIVDAVRSGASSSSVGLIAQNRVNIALSKTYTDKTPYVFGNPPSTTNFTKPAIPALVSTKTLVAAGKASTDTTSPRQAAIVKELTARFGFKKANEMIDDKKAKLRETIKQLEKQLAAI